MRASNELKFTIVNSEKMDKAKREKLEATGWRIGSAADFLQLSREESAIVDVRLSLSNALRDRRRGLKLSQANFAKRLGSSQSRVAKMEASDPTVSLDLIIKSLLTSGMSINGLASVLTKKASTLSISSTSSAALAPRLFPGIGIFSKTAVNIRSAKLEDCFIQLA
jgi:transcriptional regulator with XRE-family HTH domain